MTDSTPDIARIAAGLSERVREVLAETKAMHREYLERSERRHAEAMASLAESSAVLTARMPSGAKPMTDIVERLEEVSAIVQKEFGRVAGSACLSTEAAAEIRRLRAEVELVRGIAREAVLALSQHTSYGCPACPGDCASANPPVMVCPTQAALNAFAMWDAYQKETSHDD